MLARLLTMEDEDFRARAILRHEFKLPDVWHEREDRRDSPDDKEEKAAPTQRQSQLRPIQGDSEAAASVTRTATGSRVSAAPVAAQRQRRYASNEGPTLWPRDEFDAMLTSIKMIMQTEWRKVCWNEVRHRQRCTLGAQLA